MFNTKLIGGYVMEEISQDIINRISTGNAILFVGAGFSKGAVNFKPGNDIPTSKELARLIGKIGDFNSEDDLQYAADFFINKYVKDDVAMDNLINELKKTFYIKESKKEHQSVVKVPWRRIYTTNYDNLIEESGRAVGKIIESKDIDDAINGQINTSYCVHINGFIANLDKKELNNKFKLSKSSYLSSSNSFIESNWNYIFKRDLELSSAVIFIGYSLYDIDIEKILFENLEYKKKIFFIEDILKQNEEPNARRDFIFSKYGSLIRLGVKGFADLIEKNLHIIEERERSFFTEAFYEFKNSNNHDNQIGDNDIEDFLRFGILTQEFIEKGMTHDSPPPINKKV